MSNKKKFYQYLGSFFCLWMIYAFIRHIDVRKIRQHTKVEYVLNDESLTFSNSMKYILMWTHNFTEPFNKFKSGSEVFTDYGCSYNNCYVTNNRQYLKSIVDWDAVLFHAPEYTWERNPWNHGIPASRDPKQIYIFTSVESSAYYPVTDKKWNSYFNWTMTYKMDSDVPWLYFNIKDENGTVIGPAKNITWITDTENALSNAEKQALKTKNKAAAWFVSNCNALSKRENYIHELSSYLKPMNLTIDIYGRCGKYKCAVVNDTACWKQLKEQYYFYLSFENSFSEDYVTEKFLNAMQHRLVPIVWGRSNYTRFAPPNSYINANEISPENLAIIINNLMNNHEEYEKYFKWIKHYTYISSYDDPETNAFCKLCKALNEPSDGFSKTYTDFMKWWNK